MRATFVVLRKEWAEFQAGFFTSQNLFGGAISIAIILAVCGVYMPAQMGTDWMGSVTMFTCLIFLVPFTVVGTTVPNSFVGERERHTLEALLATPASDLAILLGKILAPMLYGWGSSLASALVSLVIASSGAAPVLSGPMISVAVFALLVSLLVAILGTMTSLHARTYLQAQRNLVGSLILPMSACAYLLGPFSPDGWKSALIRVAMGVGRTNTVIGMAILLLLFDVALILLARARFQRKQLLLGQ